MKRKAVLLFFMIGLLTALFELRLSVPASANPDVIWVPDQYLTIQGAINAAGYGDTIMVRAGTYRENIEVNKPLRLIGEGFPVINGSYLGMFGRPTVIVYAENVTISGFVIQHEEGHYEFDSGIALVSTSGGNISGNIIRLNAGNGGIDMSSGAINNLIANNLIEHNGGHGICLGGSGNMVSGNRIQFNSDYGILLGGRSNTLVNNTIVENHDAGIELWNNQTTLRNNYLAGNGNLNFYFDGGYGLSNYIQDIDNSNTVDGKPMYYWINEHDKVVPEDAGYVAIVNSTNITVENLTLEKNSPGLTISFSANVTVENCTISNNYVGVYLWASSNVTIHHNNFVQNTYMSDPWGRAWSPGTWDLGYPSGGNYWSGYSGVDLRWGPYQNLSGSDGIGDTPLVIDTNNRDNYPLMSRYEYWSNPIPGDINRDTRVNYSDLLSLAAAYGSTPVKPNWNPNADINGDGKVNYKDLNILAINYGKTYP